MSSRKLRIAVILGGTSDERDISLLTGNAVLRGLDRSRYAVTRYDPKTQLAKLFRDATKKRIDVAFIALHGPGGEDGGIQGFLDTLAVRYVGSGVLASALAMDKAAFKIAAASAGVTVPPHLELKKGDWRKNPRKLLQKAKSKFGWPKVVKPNDQGSSLGMTIAHTPQELRRGLRTAFRYGDRVLIEPYLGRREFTVATLGNENPKPLPVIEIVPTRAEFFSYEVKYDGSTQEICPARISHSLSKRLQAIAVRVHALLGGRGVLRTDFLLAKGIPYVIETNTLPGLTAESLVPKAARAAGMPFPKLLDELIRFARQSRGSRGGR